MMRIQPGSLVDFTGPGFNSPKPLAGALQFLSHNPELVLRTNEKVTRGVSLSTKTFGVGGCGSNRSIHSVTLVDLPCQNNDDSTVAVAVN